MAEVRNITDEEASKQAALEATLEQVLGVYQDAGVHAGLQASALLHLLLFIMIFAGYTDEKITKHLNEVLPDAIAETRRIMKERFDA